VTDENDWGESLGLSAIARDHRNDGAGDPSARLRATPRAGDDDDGARGGFGGEDARRAERRLAVAGHHRATSRRRIARVDSSPETESLGARRRGARRPFRARFESSKWRSCGAFVEAPMPRKPCYSSDELDVSK